MKYIHVLMAIAVFSNAMASEDPAKLRLRFGDEITWKQFFDAGFRPRLVMDGKSFCRLFGIHLSISSENSPLWLDMGKGNAFFHISRNDLVLKFSFDTTENLTPNEAEQKLQKFQRIFGSKIKSSVRGSVEYNESQRRYNYDKSTSLAVLKNWRIRYSMTPSYQEMKYPQPPREEWKPFVERLSIVYRGDLLNHALIRDKVIEPPAGYHNVSIALPIASATPDPGASPNEEQEAMAQGASGKQRTDKRTASRWKAGAEEKPFRWYWWAILGAAVLAMAAGVAKFCRRG